MYKYLPEVSFEGCVVGEDCEIFLEKSRHAVVFARSLA